MYFLQAIPYHAFISVFQHSANIFAQKSPLTAHCLKKKKKKLKPLAVSWLSRCSTQWLLHISVPYLLLSSEFCSWLQEHIMDAYVSADYHVLLFLWVLLFFEDPVAYLLLQYVLRLMQSSVIFPPLPNSIMLITN